MSLSRESPLELGNPPAADSGIFGMTVAPQDAKLVLIPVPWEVTASYGRGTSRAPSRIVPVSHQLDLFDEFFGEPYRQGIALMEPMPGLADRNAELLSAVDRARGVATSGLEAGVLQRVNEESLRIQEWVQATSRAWLDQGRLVGVLGGDHSCPLGLMRALGVKHQNFGILHIDAHFDLRQAYEGFPYSHASIMYNAVREVPSMSKLVQVGIRDFSRGEWEFAQSLGERSLVATDRTWYRWCQDLGVHGAVDKVIRGLPDKVYISFDIDGLDPALCPLTGTPVPGGLSFRQGMSLIEAVVQSGRQVIGFDLCEVGTGSDEESGEWDLNVGARVLYALCGAALYPWRGL